MGASSLSFSYHDLLQPRQGMLEDVLEGLACPQKQIQPKYFYDAEGCRLFEKICALPEYYPTRSELMLMRHHAQTMAQRAGAGCVVIEIGCGNSEKSRLLLDHLRPSGFIAVDIAGEQLEASCRELAGAFPDMAIIALRADFAQPLDLPPDVLRVAGRRILYFPGSTIGNFTPREAQAFLRRWAPVLGRGGAALIGVDLAKDTHTLTAAYNDAQGITAAFNLNVLARLNRELNATFDLCAFRHHAFFNAAQQRIEMHLVSTRDQEVCVGGRPIFFRKSETLHTESSYKYSVPGFQALALGAGFHAEECWVDSNRKFGVHYLTLSL